MVRSEVDVRGRLDVMGFDGDENIELKRLQVLRLYNLISLVELGQAHCE